VCGRRIIVKLYFRTFLALRLLALFGELDGLFEWRTIDPRLSVESVT